MGLFDDLNTDVLNASDYRGSFGSSGGYTPDFSWTQRGLDMPASGGGGGFMSGLKDVASSIWGTSGTKTTEGTGVRGFMDDLGSIARTVLPLAQIGGGIGSFLAQRDAMDQLKRQGRTAEQATNQQISSAQTAQRSAEMAQEIAPQAVELAPRIEAVAESVRPVTERLAATGQSIRDTAAATRAQTVDPVIAFATDRLARAQRGEIPPQIQAQIDRWKSGALQQARDYLARSGMGDSTAMVQLERQIEEQAQAAAARYLMDEETQALSAYQQATTGMGAVSNQYGQSVAPEQAILQGLDVESIIRGRSGAALGTAGNILAGAGASAGAGAGGAGGAARTLQNEQLALEQLIASINAALGRLSGRAA